MSLVMHQKLYSVFINIFYHDFNSFVTFLITLYSIIPIYKHATVYQAFI